VKTEYLEQVKNLQAPLEISEGVVALLARQKYDQKEAHDYWLAGEEVKTLALEKCITEL
jgi:hypothetical protein